MIVLTTYYAADEKIGELEQGVDVVSLLQALCHGNTIGFVLFVAHWRHFLSGIEDIIDERIRDTYYIVRLNDLSALHAYLVTEAVSQSFTFIGQWTSISLMQW